jgi:hypothetical protein
MDLTHSNILSYIIFETLTQLNFITTQLKSLLKSTELEYG